MCANRCAADAGLSRRKSIVVAVTLSISGAVFDRYSALRDGAADLRSAAIGDFVQKAINVVLGTELLA